jgi:hypothetical protein
MSDPKKAKPPRPFEPIDYQFEGKTHYGRFCVWRGWLTLSCDAGHKSAPLNGSPPQVLAQLLFRDIIADDARR